MQGDRAESNRRQTDSQSVSGNQHRTRPQRKVWDSNPHDPRVARFSKPARPTLSGYLPSSLGCQVDRMGVEPIAPTLQELVAPNGMPAHLFFNFKSREVRPGIEPGLLPYHGSVRPKHLQTMLLE